ncbi:hypothetical protein K9M74_01440 [Candidatus Woesearchaeota archaeon]|nr:hypothetical protein [Candidatus Woesearchaeota archaeon]
MGILIYDHLREGRRMFFRHLRVRGKRFYSFTGNANQIGKQILDTLWNGQYFRTSLGNYPVFYARDFGMAIQSLLELGYKEKVRKTLDYAMNCYMSHGGITTYIATSGKPVNFPNVYSPDSVAHMFRSLAILNDKELIATYKDFLQYELDKFYKTATFQITGEIKRFMHFGGMRDHHKRDGSCYDTVMAAIISREAEHLGLQNPFKRFNYSEIIIDQFWNGIYFNDDRSTKTLTADANIYPFWYGIIEDKTKLTSVIHAMQKLNLDKPFPIKYIAEGHPKGKTIFVEFLVRNWESQSIWPMSGLPYIDILGDIDADKAHMHLEQYKRLIEDYGTFLEVYGGNGKPFKSAVYSSDEGMIWVAQYLLLAKEHGLK